MPDISPSAATMLALLGKHSPVCVVDIPRKGGATNYSLRRMEEYLDAERGVVYLTCAHGGVVIGTAYFRDVKADFTLSGLHELSAPPMPKFHTILVNHLIGWTLPESAPAPLNGSRGPRYIPALLDIIATTAHAQHARLDVVIHDYFPVCPNFTLLNDMAQEHYCGVPDSAGCAACMRQPFMQNVFGPDFSLPAWRSAWDAFLTQADRVLLPSKTARDIVLRAFAADNKRFIVAPHAPLVPAANPIPLPGKEHPMHIVVAGQITVPKGAVILQRLASLLPKQVPDARLTLVGTLAAPEITLPDSVTITGPYKTEQLPRLLRDIRATVGLLPSIWPETFNYVAQELMLAGLPLVCFNLGAPAERVREWEYGAIAAEVSAQAALDALCALDAKRFGQ